MEGSWEIIIQSYSSILLQLLLSWYKEQLFFMKIVKHLNKVSVFYWYLIRFNFDFWLMNCHFEGKIWSTRWFKIYPNRTIKSKSKFFLSSSIRVFGLILAKIVEIDFGFLLHCPIWVNYISLTYSPLLALKIMIFTLFWILKYYFDALIKPDEI